MKNEAKFLNNHIQEINLRRPEDFTELLYDSGVVKLALDEYNRVHLWLTDEGIETVDEIYRDWENRRKSGHWNHWSMMSEIFEHINVNSDLTIEPDERGCLTVYDGWHYSDDGDFVPSDRTARVWHDESYAVYKWVNVGYKQNTALDQIPPNNPGNLPIEPVSRFMSYACGDIEYLLCGGVIVLTPVDLRYCLSTHI